MSAFRKADQSVGPGAKDARAWFRQQDDTIEGKGSTPHTSDEVTDFGTLYAGDNRFVAVF